MARMRPLLCLPALAVALAATLLPSEARADAPWMLDASLGTVRLKSDEFRFSGDLTAGYATPALGVVGNGFVSYYDLKQTELKTDFLRTGGGGEVWYQTNNSGRGVHFQVRGSGGGYLYSSTTAFTDGRQIFFDEDSVFGRGSLLLGLKIDTTDHFFLEVIGGGGGQFEWYDRLDATNATKAVDSDKQTLTFRAEGRLALRWSFVPDTLGLRVKASGQTFRLSRTTETQSFSAGNNTGTLQLDELRQTEATARLYLEAASFFGVTPGAFGGFDYFATSGTAGSNSVFLPTFGLGLFKDIR